MELSEETESTLIRLYCVSCDNADCPICPASSWIPFDNNLQGCNRRVLEDLNAQYQHLTQEVLPFLKYRKNFTNLQSVYNQIDALEEFIFNAPLGTRYDRKGKALS